MGDLNGRLGYVFLISIVDAALLSWVVLRWYRYSVRTLMQERLSPATQPDVVPVPAAAPVSALPDVVPPPLSVALYWPSPEATPNPSVDHAESIGWRRLTLAYGLGAALHAAVISAFAFGFDTSLPFAAWFAAWWMYAWPLVPTLSVVLVLDRRMSLRLGGGFVLAGSIALALVTLGLQVLRGSFNTAPLTNMYFFNEGLLTTASLPLLLLLITGWRRIRAVTPLALASTLCFGFALLLFQNVFVSALGIESVRNLILSLSALSSTNAAYYGTFMILVLPVGWLAWRLLRLLAAGFAHKRFSDVQLVVDCWWLIVTAEAIAVHLAGQYGLSGIAIGVAAFAAYRVGVAAALPRTSARARELPARLLLLRVFGYQTRTESLFDRVAQRWRFRGPVQLIAGADLAMRTADPGDMLAFVSGSLDQQYVATPGEVPKRLGGLDLRPDPDGRFRVNEVFCRDDTWRPTLQALLDVSDTVLMDLRTFSEWNSGCAYELEQLVRRLPTDRIILVYDGTTDLKLLSRFLGEAWASAAREAHPRSTGPIACVRIERNSWRELQVLMQRLIGRGEPQQVRPIAELATV